MPDALPEFENVTNEEFGEKLSKVIKGRIVKSVAFEGESEDEFMIISFTDESVLKIRYDWIYDIEVIKE